MTTILSTNIYSAKSVSPVDQVLNAAKGTSSSSSSSTSSTVTNTKPGTPGYNYQDQDWFIAAKVGQLKAQLALYQAVPGLDPDGSIQDSITSQANALVAKQQAKIKAAQADAAAKQAALDKQNAEATENAKVPSADQLLARAKSRAAGETVAVWKPSSSTDSTTSNGDNKVISTDQMLANAKSGRGGSVNTTA